MMSLAEESSEGLHTSTSTKIHGPVHTDRYSQLLVAHMCAPIYKMINKDLGLMSVI